VHAAVASAVSFVPSAKLISARNGQEPPAQPVDESADWVADWDGGGTGAALALSFAQRRSARWRLRLLLTRSARLRHVARSFLVFAVVDPGAAGAAAAAARVVQMKLAELTRTSTPDSAPFAMRLRSQVIVGPYGAAPAVNVPFTGMPVSCGLLK
jgi:hypothetical protein